MKLDLSLVALAVFAALLVLPTSSMAIPMWLQDLTGMRTSRTLRYVRSADLSHQKSTFKLDIVHLNDMHSRFEQTNRLSGVCSPWEVEHGQCYGGYGRVSTIIKQAREAASKGETPPVLVLNAGDNFQGTLYYTLFKAEIVTKFTNLLNFDVLSLGNHEFDDGPKGLEPFLRNVKSPVIAANVDISKSKELEGIKLPPSIVLEVKGRKIGVIGYLTPETSFLSDPQDVEISDDIEAVQREAKRLTEEGIQIIIALGHSGYNVDQKMAKEIPELDIVVGGHSHTFLYNDTVDDLPDKDDIPKGMYPTIVIQKSGKKVPVVQAYAFTKYIGRLSLSFDDEGELTYIHGNPLLLDKNIPEDPVILEELKTWNQRLDNYTNKIEGSSPVLLDNAQCRYAECNIGNAIADAFVFYRATSFAKKKITGWTDAPIAFMNGGSIRSSIDGRSKNNSIALRDLLDVMPFGNLITVVKLKGDVLVEMLEHGVSRYDPTFADNKGAFPQVSGLKVTYNVKKPPGHRVESVFARCSDCDVPRYFPLKGNETYTILVNSFIANGGDGYNMIKEKGELTVLDDIDSDVFVAYMNEQSPIYPEVSFRIIIKNSATLKQISTLLLIPTLILAFFRDSLS